MDLKNKVILGFLFIGILSIIVYPSLKNNDVNLVDCSKPFSVFYITPQEISQSSKILNELPNTIVCIPELNQCNFKSDIVNCQDFKYENYLNPNFIKEWQKT